MKRSPLLFLALVLLLTACTGPLPQNPAGAQPGETPITPGSAALTVSPVAVSEPVAQDSAPEDILYDYNTVDLVEPIAAKTRLSLAMRSEIAHDYPLILALEAQPLTEPTYHYPAPVTLEGVEKCLWYAWQVSGDPAISVVPLEQLQDAVRRTFFHGEGLAASLPHIRVPLMEDYKNLISPSGWKVPQLELVRGNYTFHMDISEAGNRMNLDILKLHQVDAGNIRHDYSHTDYFFSFLINPDGTYALESADFQYTFEIEPPPAAYMEITAVLEDAWENPALQHKHLGSHGGLLYFCAQSPQSYELYSINPVDFSVQHRRSLPYFHADLSFRQGKTLLKARESVTVLDEGFATISQQPVPQVVLETIAGATLIPENLAGYDPRPDHLRYDIANDLATYVYTDDYGLYFYNTATGQQTVLVTFPEPETAGAGYLYYPHHLWRPRYSEDNKVVTADSISMPMAGGSSSYINFVDSSSGEVTQMRSVDYYMRYNNAELPYYPLVYKGYLTAEHDLYYRDGSFVGERTNRYYLGPVIDNEALVAEIDYLG